MNKKEEEEPRGNVLVLKKMIYCEEFPTWEYYIIATRIKKK